MLPALADCAARDDIGSTAMLFRHCSRAQDDIALQDDPHPPADFASYRDAKAKKARVDAAYYILDGHAAVPADAHTWHRWSQSADRMVEQTSLGADTTVSTMFIGFDEDLDPASPAIFETEVSNTGNETNKGIAAVDGFRRRYATWEGAVAGHRAIVALLTAIQKHRRPHSSSIPNPIGASARAEQIGELAADFVSDTAIMIADFKAQAEAARDPGESAGDAPATAVATDLRFLNAIIDATTTSLSEMWTEITSIRSKLAGRTRE